jgi:membrane fusion protein, hemolysin D
MKPADQGQAAVVALRRPLPARRRTELEFLPAALEIVETPVSPLARGIIFVIVGFFVCAVLWASIGKVDIIATAPGRVVPTGRVKVIQPFAIGVVRAIRVADGDRVKAGQVLVELDPTIDTADKDRTQTELMAQLLTAARLEAALSGNPADFVPPPGTRPAEAALQRSLLQDQLDEFHAKLGDLDRQIIQAQANRDAVAASVQKLVVAIPLLQQRAAARKYLADRGVGSKLDYLQVEQDLVEHQQELQVQKARLLQAEAGLGALEQQRLQAAAEFRRTNLSDLTQAQDKAAALRQDLVKATERNRLQTLKSPVDGTVQQLAVHTVGGVVTPAQQLMVIVPADSHLEIEAMVSNRDIGFVHPGERAAIKVDTFDFTRYGLLRGTVTGVSQDAIERDRGDGGSGRQEPPAFAGASPFKDQELAYAARIALDRTAVEVGGKPAELSPGMAVTVEIKTGRRRVIDFLLSPLLRYKDAAFRER